MNQRHTALWADLENIMISAKQNRNRVSVVVQCGHIHLKAWCSIITTSELVRNTDSQALSQT